MRKTTFWQTSFILFIPIILLSGCMRQFSTTPIPNDTQKINYHKGNAAIVSYAKESVCLAEQPKNLEGQVLNPCSDLEFYVLCKNTSQEEIVLSTKNMSLFINNKQLNLTPYEKLKQEIMSSASFGKAMSALSGAALEASSAYSGNQMIIGSYKGDNFMAFGYDQNKAISNGLATQQRTNSELASIDAKTRMRLASIDSMLRDETILPNQHHGGFIRSQIPCGIDSNGVFKVKIDFGSETHNFLFNYQEIKK